MNVPHAATKAAVHRLRGLPYTQMTETEITGHVLDAAMPAIREALAQEIEADESDDWTDAPRRRAARIVRGGTP